MSIDQDDHLTDTTDAFRRLEAIIYVFGLNKRIWRYIDDFFPLTMPHEAEQFCLSSIIKSFDVNQRVWSILEKRYGFHRRFTFEEIAIDLGGVTKARVQQIESRALEKVKNRISKTINPLLRLDQQIHEDWASLETATSINEAIFLYQKLLSDIGWEVSSGKEIRCLFLVLRALVQTNPFGIERHLPHLSYVACRLSPAILKHPKLAEQERERQRKQIEQERTWTYEELAEAVLADSTIPLHYAEIARRAEDLEHRSNVNLRGMHNVLYSNTDKFAYVDQGTYGLTSWGLTSVDAYTNIIAEILTSAHKALPYGNILQAVNAKRLIKQQTLQMTLDMHPRFYCSQEGTYGLRAWLPPREKQTLRTPKWQVEMSQSFERVERAVERGYDIEMIVAQDKI